MKEIDPIFQRQCAFLLANNDAYEHLVKKIKIKKTDIGDLELILNKVTFAAHFATRFHPGKFADGALENIALEIGRMLPDISDEYFENINTDNKPRRILHVASQVQKIGGHSRMIYHWIKCDKDSYHSLAVLNQEEDIPVPRWLSEAVNGRNLFVFPQGKGICEKAQLLRNIARKYADIVVLHIDGYEVIPTVAFAVDNCPPITLVNHFDHHFWLGSSVIDVVIDLRRIGAEYTLERRYVPSYILPIPLNSKINEKSRYKARHMLGIPEDQVVIISIGRAEKYWPYGPYDFVATAGKILARHDEAHIYVVGESLEGIAPRLRSEVHNRLHFVGMLEDPSLYRNAADIYMESFPYGTQTSLLEAALEGLPVVPSYNPIFSLLVANDDALKDILRNPLDENEYIDQVGLLIKDPEQRILLGKKLQKRLLMDHVGDGWLNKLIVMYQKTDSLVHKPRYIPNVLCETTDADIGLSTWHVIIDNKNYRNNDEKKQNELALLWHIALLSEYCGDYAKAVLFSYRAIFLDPRGSWRIFARLRGKMIRLINRFLKARE